MSTPHLDNATWVLLHDQARLRAELLRREAMNDFWRGTHAVFQRSLACEQSLAMRSAARLKARLTRRAKSAPDAVSASPCRA
ncbi:hypothetical protein [Hydrogenophaga sp.]|uniref:hypothetical protein n=1 Tax=Hydrogenophaga sp. TaxID=1904254 RepID=UPI0035617C02